MIAALFVDPAGIYSKLQGLDLWCEARDARAYSGPHPVIAHPPCERWGRYWGGGPSAAKQRYLGDDKGCFAAALWAVRTFGGVLEHPEASHAWRWHGLERPKMGVGWIAADSFDGWTCCVFQGHYGHPAPKATWLYAVRAVRPEMNWTRAQGLRLDEGFHSSEERRAARNAGQKPRKRLSKQDALATPREFAQILIEMARSVNLKTERATLKTPAQKSFDLP